MVTGEVPGDPIMPSVVAPEVKICGLTRVDEAAACVELGAKAIGCVFYPPSPRCVTEDRAREICQSLPPHVWGVGVFVNESFAAIMGKVERCGLKAVQLHGRESSELVADLRRRGLLVIKSLFINVAPSLDCAGSYGASAFLVECAGGPLPGGNALSWDWSAASGMSARGPLILAGGLNSDNVGEAIRLAGPDAVDVSSGVEAAPGRKDVDKVKRFFDAVQRVKRRGSPRCVFL